MLLSFLPDSPLTQEGMENQLVASPVGPVVIGGPDRICVLIVSYENLALLK
jgi:hypothetical protein